MTAMAPGKEALMAQNAKLLGFDGAAELEAGAFDRPNEKLLLRLLHFLLARLAPAAAHEFRFCWPVATPHDKSNFKRLVQARLQELEKQRLLPVGASQASRINTGYCPRTVELLWRLSTLVIKEVMAREFPSYALRPPPGSAEVGNADAVTATKALIAMKTKQNKTKFVQRSQLQDEWCSFAEELTEKIQKLNALQQQMHEAQAQLDITVSREIFSQVKTEQRSQKLQSIETAWASIDELTSSRTYKRSTEVLGTALQYSQDQPILSAAKMLPTDVPTRVPRGQLMNLNDVVQDAQQFLDAVRCQVDQERVGKLVQTQASSESSSLTDICSHYVAQLNTMILRIQAQLAEVRNANDEDARRLYLELADTGVSDSSMIRKSAMKLCPPTPALPAHEEYKLVSSMKKISMGELSGQEKQIKREQQYELELTSQVAQNGEGLCPTYEDSSEVIRTLRYDDTELD